MNAKIVVTIILSFVVAFLILFTFANWYQSHYDRTYQYVQSIEQRDSNETKILILGSSHVLALNSTYIDEYLSENDKKNYKVYNLASPSDYPSRRLESLGALLELKPKIIVYGIDLRMFEGQNSAVDDPITALQISKPTSVLPDSQQVMDDMLFGLEHNDFTSKIPKSPKLITLESLHHILHYKENLADYPYSEYPLFSGPLIYTIADNDKLRENWETSPLQFHGIKNYDKNVEYMALNEMIDTLNKNNIKVIIFTTPFNEVFLDHLPSDEKQAFDSMIEELSKKQNTKVYSIYDKYGALPIWSNVDHIAINKNGTIYSQDIARFIQDGVSS